MQRATWVSMDLRSPADRPPLMAAAVATFIKTGVSMVPWTVSIRARLAIPSCFSNVYIQFFPLLFYVFIGISLIVYIFIA